MSGGRKRDRRGDAAAPSAGGGAAGDGTSPDSTRISLPGQTRLPYASEPEGSTHSFWSYVREDDRATFGKIALLRDDICTFYRFETGVRIQIFMDRDNVGWGQQWQSLITQGINTTTFLIPIVTPSYFQSQPCRDELLRFDALCRKRGLDELILPILLSGRTRVSIESDDPVARIIAAAQFRDFSEVWLVERGSESWNRAVRDIVFDLIEAERRAESQLSQFAINQSNRTDRRDEAVDDGDTEDDSLGIVELLGDVESKINQIAPTVEQAVSDFNALSDVLGRTPLSNNTAASDPRSFQRNIILSAQMFRAEAQQFEQSSSAALESVRDADAIMTPLRLQLEELNDPSFLVRFLESMAPLRDVSTVAEQMDDVLVQMRDLERMSSVLRKELRPARKAITFLRESANIAASWTA